MFCALVPVSRCRDRCVRKIDTPDIVSCRRDSLLIKKDQDTPEKMRGLRAASTLHLPLLFASTVLALGLPFQRPDSPKLSHRFGYRPDDPFLKTKGSDVKDQRPTHELKRASAWASFMLLASLIVLQALLPLQSVAQSNEVSESNEMDAPASQVHPAAVPKPRAPIGAVSFGYIYLASEDSPGAWRYHFQGFFGIPQVNVNHWLGFNGDFTQSYNTSAGAHQNVQARLGGIVFTAKSSARISPFGFADAGVVRNSNAGTVNSSPALALGGGFSMKLTKRVALLFIPGEFIKTWPPTGPNNTLNNFSARFGITLPLYR
jgi:hypothetical protein